jgi:anti-anti-sigma regulatory factor
MPILTATLAEARSGHGTMSVTSDTASDELVVRGSGELDAALRPTFDGVLDTVTRSTAPTRLDFHDVTFCEAEGVHMIRRLHLATRGRRVRFGAAACVRRSLALCGSPLPRHAAA